MPTNKVGINYFYNKQIIYLRFMGELILKIIEEGEWKPLRFTVYNYLEEKERYQQNLAKLGYECSYDDFECKTFECGNLIAKTFKRYVENKLQNDKVVITICVLDDRDFFTVVKPKNVDIVSALGEK